MDAQEALKKLNAVDKASFWGSSSQEAMDLLRVLAGYFGRGEADEIMVSEGYLRSAKSFSAMLSWLSGITGPLSEKPWILLDPGFGWHARQANSIWAAHRKIVLSCASAGATEAAWAFYLAGLCSSSGELSGIGQKLSGLQSEIEKIALGAQAQPAGSAGARQAL